MSTRQRSRLVNFNRLLILALTLTGLLMDGVQRVDLPFTLALVVWLWLAVFARMEAEILSRARRLPTGARQRAYKGRWDEDQVSGLCSSQNHATRTNQVTYVS